MRHINYSICHLKDKKIAEKEKNQEKKRKSVLFKIVSHEAKIK